MLKQGMPQKVHNWFVNVLLCRTFEPLWGVIRVATEKHANAHLQVVQKMQDVIKNLKEYGEKQKERHKQVGVQKESPLRVNKLDLEIYTVGAAFRFVHVYSAVLYPGFKKWGSRRPPSRGSKLGFQGSNQLILIIKVALYPECVLSI